MRRRGRPPTRRAPAREPVPEEERIEESSHVPPPPVPSEPSQAGPPVPPEMAGGNIPVEQMAQILAAALRKPREPGVSIERARKLGARMHN